MHVNSLRAITLENTLVILSTVAPDAGRYYAQAVNDKNGENKTSQPITLTVESKYSTHKDLSNRLFPTQRFSSTSRLFVSSADSNNRFLWTKCTFIVRVQLFTSDIHSKQQLHNSWLSHRQQKHREGKNYLALTEVCALQVPCSFIISCHPAL